MESTATALPVLTSALDRGEFPASLLWRFTYSSHRIGDWVDSISGLDAVEYREKSRTYAGNRNLDIQSVVIQT
jgi:hypothetical protein